MKFLILFLIALATIAAFVGVTRAATHLGKRVAYNSALTHPEGHVTLKAGEAFSSKYLLGKRDASNADEVAVCDATDYPLGIVIDEADAEDVTAGEPITVHLLGATVGTQRMVGSKAIADDTDVYTTANGKVTDTPVAGSYKVGTSFEACGGDGKDFAVIPCKPESPVLVASGVHTWAGGAATTDSIDTSGFPGSILATDTILATIVAQAGSETTVVAEADAGNDQIDLTLDANGTDTTTKIAYQVWR